jgi:TM2 domain-containing membrane protein YozV
MSRDLRKFASQTNTRLALGGLILLFVVGDGLIYLVYGGSAALFGFLCLVAGLSPVVLIWLVLWLIERIKNHIDQY